MGFFLCLVLFAAWLSVFCVPCLSCVISACCACSGPTVTAYLVLPAYVGGGGGPPPSPLVPACSLLASWWAVPDARCAMVMLLAGNPIGLDGAAGLAALVWAPSIVQRDCFARLLLPGVAVGDPSASYIMIPSCVFPVSPQEILLPPRFRALSHGIAHQQTN